MVVYSGKRSLPLNIYSRTSALETQHTVLEGLAEIANFCYVLWRCDVVQLVVYLLGIYPIGFAPYCFTVILLAIGDKYKFLFWCVFVMYNF